MYETSQSGGSLGITWILVMVGIYLFFGLTMYRIAKKTGCHNNAWWAYVPILNALLLCDMAGKPKWWFFLCLVPLVNLVIFAMLWYQAACRAGFSGWLGVLTLVPFINVITLCVMAFGSGSQPTPTNPTYQEQPRQMTKVS